MLPEEQTCGCDVVPCDIHANHIPIGPDPNDYNKELKQDPLESINLSAGERYFIDAPINGLLKIPLKWNVDDRGMLMEVLRATDEHYQNATDVANPHAGNFGQNYIVIDPMPYTVRAFHKHGLLWDFFTILNGSAKFIFFDDRDGKDDISLSDTYEHLEIVVTGRMNPLCIVVPPGILHGWVSLEPNTILLSTGTHVYSEIVKNHGQPDECRISPDTFGDLWKVEAK